MYRRTVLVLHPSASATSAREAFAEPASAFGLGVVIMMCLLREVRRSLVDSLARQLGTVNYVVREVFTSGYI